jgi:hypothetical protein
MVGGLRCEVEGERCNLLSTARRQFEYVDRGESSGTHTESTHLHRFEVNSHDRLPVLIAPLPRDPLHLCWLGAHGLTSPLERAAYVDARPRSQMKSDLDPP